MSRHVLGQFLRRLPGELLPPGPGEAPDAELLDRFLRGRDEAAFELLVGRHARMVFGVCRRILGHAQDAEDAFQATFLALVRKGRSVRQQTLGGWLYRVAYRVALRARRDVAPRTVRAGEGFDVAAPEVPDAAGRELGPVLDEEVNRLPEKHRAAVVMCYLSGRSTAEAAVLLGVPRGTVLSRLAWARQRLRRRLVRRGVAPVVAGLTAGLASVAAEAAPPGWVRTTVQAATSFAAGSAAAGGAVSARAVALMEGVFRAMTIARVKVAVAVLALVALVGVGLLRWALAPQDALAQDSRRDAPSAGRRDDGPRTAGKLPAGDADRPDVRAAGPAGVVRPIGTWERQFGPAQSVVRIDEDHAYVSVDLTVEGLRLKVEGEADYSITKDSVLYGVITSVDVQGLDSVKDGKLEAAGLATMVNLLIDYPFSLRYRVDDNVLTVKDVNVGMGLLALEGGDRKMEEMLGMKAYVVGRYKKKTAADVGPRFRP